MRSFFKALVGAVVLAALIWLASGLRWPGFSDPNGDWFRLVSQLSATTLGGLIAASVTWFFAEKKRREERRASLLRLFLDLVYVVGGLSNLLKTIDEMLAEANADDQTNLPLWARIKPISGMISARELDVSDLGILLDAKEDAVVNDVILLDSRNKSTFDAMRTYNELRLELRGLMPVHAGEGSLGTTNLSTEQMATLKPRFQELEQLIGSIIEHLRTDVPFAHDLIGRYSLAAETATGQPFPKSEPV
jgi:hypothetical protein